MSHKILVVEDEESHRSLLERVLRRAGFDPIFAVDGEKGKELVQKESPTLAILDWNLPKMDGGQLARWIRKNEKLRHLPILMLTVRRKSDQEVLGFESGADDYLPKPYSPKELLARLQRLLNLKELK